MATGSINTGSSASETPFVRDEAARTIALIMSEHVDDPKAVLSTNTQVKDAVMVLFTALSELYNLLGRK